MQSPPSSPVPSTPSAGPNPPPDPGIVAKPLSPDHPAWRRPLAGGYAAGPWLGWLEGGDEKTSWAAFVDRFGQGVLWYRDANGKQVGDGYGFHRGDLVSQPSSAQSADR